MAYRLDGRLASSCWLSEGVRKMRGSLVVRLKPLWRRSGDLVDRCLVTARHSLLGRRKGQALVETAVVLPILLLLSLGVFEFGRAFHAHTAVVRAAREGARVGMNPSAPNLTIAAAAEAAASPIPLASVSTSRASGQVSVTTIHLFEAVAPMVSALWGGGPLTVQSSYTVREYGP